ncbi:MAG: ArsI/CadI family heavy metal resistance metalloenzyme [Pirellulales bacterium]
MSQESAVQFETASRIHVGLAVRDLEPSVAFYRTLFGRQPTKTRPHYAKFEVAQPPVNLALNEVGGQTGPNNPVAHFGIQVKSTEAVKQVAERLQKAGAAIEVEENVTCCYAVQNKIWAADPDGNKWEVYVVLDNEGSQHHSSQTACCPQMGDIREAVQREDWSALRSAFETAGPMPAQKPDLASACSCSAASLT